MTSWNATLRTATADDVDAILQFYKDNPNKNVLGRSDAVRNACENGRQFLVEVEGAIVGVSGAFPSGAKSLVEVGGTRVADDWQGFGLQERLFWARFAAIVLTEDRDVQITTAVDPDNATSKHSILKQGFAKWDEPAPELLVECDPGPGRAGCEKKAALPAGAKCCSDFFLISRDALRAAIRAFLDDTKESTTVTRTRKSGDVLTLHVTCKTVCDPERREDLEAFCEGR
jgi:N-acetylglutamate synthase-like GNAT family acetyltransferase